MPETPDFDQITRRVMGEINACTPGTRLAEVPTLFAFGPIKHVLEEMWNARGAVDIATMKITVAYTLSGTVGLMKALDRAIRALDRKTTV